MDVPPMEFSLDTDIWESNPNRAASRQISTEKQAALSTLIDELLDKEVIRPSKATAWSQVHLVRKPSGGWRFTIDYRALNKVITNEGWQIPNMKEMLQRIGSLKPSVFGVADLTQGFYQMPLHKNCWAATAFISFRGIYEWTRVPMGLLPSANFFQKSMSVHILNGPLYRTCEVYIDDLLFHGQNDEDFVRNTREIFEICRNKGVILSAKKLVIGMTKVPFVGNEVDSLGLNMSQACIDSTIAFTKPATLKELSSFLGLVN